MPTKLLMKAKIMINFNLPTMQKSKYNYKKKYYIQKKNLIELLIKIKR